MSAPTAAPARPSALQRLGVLLQTPAPPGQPNPYRLDHATPVGQFDPQLFPAALQVYSRLDGPDGAPQLLWAAVVAGPCLLFVPTFGVRTRARMLFATGAHVDAD